VAALVVAIAIIAISSFFAFIGLPNSFVVVTEACSIGNACTQTTQQGTSFMTTPWAFLPLVLGGLVGYAMFKGRSGVAWAGIVGLLAFSFISMFSIGLLYLPFVIALVGLNAYASAQRASIPKVPQAV
jgi:hypothetical protein